ncbi:adenylosuccinate synthase [Actinomyces minihominis]|uniref:adenylosuccinate synthase n=1 Tax=Actinomyces minihominis TaxID=2002838 RepID=UPI000C07EA30|nr:adenylosuccinate synthase [Actinomyces minihominis]
MPGIIVVGTQWGDEGKGKATDQLGGDVDMVVKFNGGNNAGHTVVVDGESYALHLLPAGILSEKATPIIGAGVVVDPDALFSEIEAMEARGVDCSRLVISANAHVIPPYNRSLDKLNEVALGKSLIGTTGRGIGPTYADKMNRTGLRIQDLLDPELVRSQVTLNVEAKLRGFPEEQIPEDFKKDFEIDSIVETLVEYGRRIEPRIVDTSLLVNNALEAGETVLFEAGQAAMLDIDHGTYPYVTSSTAIAAGALAGVGVGPTLIDRVIGVAKAYTTRVGSGPFPTEMHGEDGEHLRDLGGEFGVTTGRARRVGWLDLVILRYARRVNGLTDIALTKLDVLDTYDTIQVAVGYEVDGIFMAEMPVLQRDFARAVPVYREMPGWKEDISGVRRFEDLPTEARDYVTFIEEQVGCRISTIGVGQARDAAIVR